MRKKGLARLLFGGTLLIVWLMPAIAFAEEAAEDAVAEAWQATAAKAIAAGLAIGLSALGAGYAQAKIGSAGAGTLAERPEVSVWVITLQALPEIIVLLGFVAAIIIIG
jgi:V/A-type H+-transporting ATPase subunit K